MNESRSAGAGVDRRTFLKYVGAGSLALFSSCGRRLGEPLLDGAWVAPDGTPLWTRRVHPVPLPSDPQPFGEDARRLARFKVIDDLVVPEEFRFEILAQYGDVFGPADRPDQQIRFGYDNDFTGLVPVAGAKDEFWLLVNHEYVAGRPWLQTFEEVFGEEPPKLELLAHPTLPKGEYFVDGWSFGAHVVDWSREDAVAKIPEAIRAKLKALARRVLADVGVSVLRLRRRADLMFEVIRDSPDHKRISAYTRQNVAGRPQEHSRFTGPASYLFENPPSGTMANCSGGVTPWGTFLTCEENFYIDSSEDIDPAGQLSQSIKKAIGAVAEKSNDVYIFNHPLPPTLYGNGHLLDPPLDGREFGWVCEIDPVTGHLKKHTALGRFRHENVALRCEAGKRLAAYMGDDRRGGHVWKFVSDEAVKDPKDPANSRLLEKGTLHVAQFHADFSGRWIPLQAQAPLARPTPEQCFSGHVQVPSRPVGGYVAVGDRSRDLPEIEVDHWMESVQNFAGKPFGQCLLGDLVRPPESADLDEAGRQNGILAMEAFLMANACGGTPSARPEDLEIHPSDRSVYIAFTENSDSTEGSPDRRIFPDSERQNSRQYGAIYRFIEGGVEGPESDPASTTFGWGKFISSGEVGEQGGGFAFADNLVFDPDENVWMVTDITTTAQNFPVDRDPRNGTQPGGQLFPGVFGNNALFMIPTRGENAGVPQLFATGPIDCELCGPTFSADGKTLILSVQHPGELDGARLREKPGEERRFVIHDRNGKPFEQVRQVPIGSNFPHGQLDRPPRPAVVCITRKKV